MAFRLPTLTIAVCVVLWVPQLALDAQQPTANSSSPIEQAQFGNNNSANPLRHRTIIAASDTSANLQPQPAVVGQSREEMLEAMPPEVRRVLYPRLSDSKSQQASVQSATHLEPVHHSTSRRHAEKQLQTPIQFEPTQSEPQPTVMAADFSRLPKPTASPALTGDAASKRNQPVASLLARNSSTAKQESASSIFSKKLAAERSGDLPPPQFQAMLGNIAGSTCLVLFLGVGFILVAKRVMKGKAVQSRQKSDEPQINVVANLRLTPKSNLHLVEVGQQRVLVASDAAGIKSVVSLTNSFASALDSLDDNAATEQASVATTESSQEAGVYEKPQPASQADTEIEAEMRRKLSEVLGGQAFKDVFYQSTRAVA